MSISVQLRQSSSSPNYHNRHKSTGFTYIGLLIVIALLGVVSVATIQVGSILQRRSAEEALLDIGAEYQRAMVSYANATINGQRSSPQSLNDLIKDPRYPKITRHLRRIYDDPLTGKNTWGLIYAKDNNGIIGIYSLSDQKPIKIGNFSLQFSQFKNKSSYREWIFFNPSLYAVGSESYPNTLSGQSVR
ncbi:type II secretion system protein [Undibacterium flavidum]|uniref:Type II secretion system protein n=1 Tax=Undibacterium flavidum TaxID=2762297 RepID=A0ABR6YAU1_9BURK|nr:type II secretion system protein [Undibacterium flavidum]MBC3873725.1 type II secretion system protein [Undibacterium flavidum]